VVAWSPPFSNAKVNMSIKHFLTTQTVAGTPNVAYWSRRNITLGSRKRLIDDTVSQTGMYCVIIHSDVREPVTVYVSINGVDIISYDHMKDVTYGNVMSSIAFHVENENEFAVDVERGVDQSIDYRVYSYLM
jgi:hypothetical protein